jgi:signal transduction histidine kinase
MQDKSNEIITFIIVTTFLILLLASFIIMILFLYKKKQIAFYENLEKIKLNHERQLLKAQLEIQEQTFQKISREIHDNIGLSLTLTKLHLNTLNTDYDKPKIDASIKCLSTAIKDLSDLSKSLNSEFILKNGFLKALENEIEMIEQLGTFKVNLSLNGEPFYLKAEKEIILFRIVQEALNNILKHSKGDSIVICLNYTSETLALTIQDNGIGFSKQNVESKRAGLKNMKQRAQMIQAACSIETCIDTGTTVQILIPNNN